jgi:hypothetical protein
VIPTSHRAEHVGTQRPPDSCRHRLQP